MSSVFLQALDAVVQRILSLAAQDPELRSHLRALAQTLLSATAELPGPVFLPAETPKESHERVPAEPGLASLATSSDFLSANSLAASVVPSQGVSHPPVPAPEGIRAGGPLPSPMGLRPRQWPLSALPASETDLPLIETRCRLKAKGARWALTRRRRTVEGAEYRTEIEPQDQAIIAEAKALPDCFLWMNHPSGPSPADLSLFEDVAGCFETAANAIALVRAVLADLENNQDVFERALDLTAEAQSALREAITRIDGPTDKDQAQLFSWLRATAAEHQLFIRRFMRADDVANPSRWSDLDARIDAVNDQMEEARKLARQRRKLLGKLRYIAKTITSAAGNDAPERWQALAAGVDELVQSGVPPSNREVRELLLPIVDDMPELTDPPQGFNLVLREIDRYLESRPPTLEVVLPPEPRAEVQEVARLLGGKSVVLIGGSRRPSSQETLKAAFGLNELLWIETREHQSLEGFEPYVARPDVAVVLLAIRWSSHSFGEVKQYCDRYGKPLVRLPGGYNVNQVARQLLSQCSDRLAPTS